MTNEIIDTLFSTMLNSAENAYESTKEAQLLGERISQMRTDCLYMFASSERGFAEECFELLADVSASKEQFIYRQGFIDCIFLLKSIKAL